MLQFPLVGTIGWEQISAMRALRCLLKTALFAGLTASASFATEPGQTVNGCGPDGILGRIVPNRIRVLGCELEKSCNAHDICYARCLLGGDLYNNPTCKDDEARKRRRQSCDETLYSSINAANGNSIFCRTAASVYKGFVTAYGASFFFGIAPPQYEKEELYRAPISHVEVELMFALTIPLEEKLKRNYEAAEAFAAYAERASLPEQEIDTALDAMATNAMKKNYTLAFRTDEAGAELLLKRSASQRGAPADAMPDEIVIWRDRR